MTDNYSVSKEYFHRVIDNMEPWDAVEILGVTSSQYREMSTEEYLSQVNSRFDNLWDQMTPEDKQNYVNEIKEAK